MPLSDRPPALRQPLYEATLQRLVPHASFPPHFTSWGEEFELDEDAFKRLRWVHGAQAGCCAQLPLHVTNNSGVVESRQALVWFIHGLYSPVHPSACSSLATTAACRLARYLCREQHLPELLDVCYGLLRMRYLQASGGAVQAVLLGKLCCSHTSKSSAGGVWAQPPRFCKHALPPCPASPAAGGLAAAAERGQLAGSRGRPLPLLHSQPGGQNSGAGPGKRRRRERGSRLGIGGSGRGPGPDARAAAGPVWPGVLA